MKLHNIVEEFLQAHNVDDFKENLSDIIDQEKIQRQLCVGHFLLYSFTKSSAEFRSICQLILDLAKSDTIFTADVEEG